MRTTSTAGTPAKLTVDGSRDGRHGGGEPFDLLACCPVSTAAMWMPWKRS
ncbi:MAG: hypothetical protein ACLUJU_10550 [Subdoligranulum sp.]